MNAVATVGSKGVGIAVGLLGLLGGIGVVAAVELDRPLWSVALVIGAPAVTVLVLGLRGASDETKRHLARRVAVGIEAGIAGLLAYDAARWGIVLLFGMSVNPFEAFPAFGQILTGSESEALRWAAGAGYHVFNGVGFAVFFAVLWGERGVVGGLLWAFALELATLAIYPGWLGIRARGEFTLVSLSGHVAYGATIGAVSAHRIRTTTDRWR